MIKTTNQFVGNKKIKTKKKSFLLSCEKNVVFPIDNFLLAKAIIWNNSKMTKATKLEIVANYLSYLALQKELDNE